jgi:hypothetical protein
VSPFAFLFIVALAVIAVAYALGCAWIGRAT